MIKIIFWVFSDLLFNKRFTFLFILNLALGLTGFVTLDSFRSHLESSLSAKSRLVLGADLGMSSRSPISMKQVELAQGILENAPFGHIVETYSMVASENGKSRLVQIKAIDNKFPFYGVIKLAEQGEQFPKKKYDLIDQNNVWVYPEVLLQLNVKVGDYLKIGLDKFKITDVVEDDSAAGFSTSMAPRVYLGHQGLKSTSLITGESLAWYSFVFKKPLRGEELSETVKSIFDLPEIDESVRVYSHENVSQGMSRMLNYLSDYLGLVSVAAIFLASIGATFLFRSHMSTKIKDIAILRSLGMGEDKIFLLYGGQILFLGVGASLISFLLSLGLAPLLSSLLSDLTSIPVLFESRWQGMGAAYLLGTLGSLLICLPILIQIKGIKPTLLFESVQGKLKESAMSLALHFLGVIVLWVLAVWQSKSWFVGSLFMGIFLISGLLLGGSSYILFWLLDYFGNSLPLSFKLAIRNLVCMPKSSISCFLALGMGVMLLNVIPQIEASLQMELERPEESKLPSFFLFDIQDGQVSSLKEIVAREGATLGQVSPMVRGRLIKVNGENFEKKNANEESFSREDQRAAQFRNRGFNLSYRKKLDASEKIIEGKEITTKFDPNIKSWAEVSVEKRFAGRLGLEIGDLLTFEVQGVPFDAKIVNLRSVRWTTFQPNFFVQFQEGVLEDAPKTFVASISNTSPDLKNIIQTKVVEKFPNISLIDVTRIVKRVFGVSEQMSLALQFMAVLCLLVGLLVMYSIASHQAKQRTRDINLIKVLGAKFSFIRNLFILEFLILGVLAGLMGVILSVGVSYGISKLLFDVLWNWDPMIPVLSFIILVSLVSFLSYLSVKKVLRSRASFYL